MKSKTRAVNIVMSTSSVALSTWYRSLSSLILGGSRSGALQYDRFQNVSCVFSLVRGSFHYFDQFLDLDQRDRVLLALEQCCQCCPAAPVSLIFQPVDLYADLQHVT